MNTTFEKYLDTIDKCLKPLPTSERVDIVKEIKVILSILVDTFISKISLTMQPGPKIDSISGA